MPSKDQLHLEIILAITTHVPVWALTCRKQNIVLTHALTQGTSTLATIIYVVAASDLIRATAWTCGEWSRGLASITLHRYHLNRRFRDPISQGRRSQLLLLHSATKELPPYGLFHTWREAAPINGLVRSFKTANGSHSRRLNPHLHLRWGTSRQRVALLSVSEC